MVKDFPLATNYHELVW